MHPRLVVLSALCRDVTMPILVVLIMASSGPTRVRDDLDLTPATRSSPPSLSHAATDVTVELSAHASANAPIADVPANAPATSTPATSIDELAGTDIETIPPAALTPERESVQPTALPPSGGSDDQHTEATDVAVVDECLVLEVCVDRYLWALYQRAPKEDTIKTETYEQVSTKKKGKLVTITKTIAKLTDEDFSWKDAKAADRAGMSLEAYVIGGMDRDFKLKLFYMLHAAQKQGLSPGITSGFRDDYRQSIASGLKAADNRSYHGGTLRGGYGHGLAADIVSIDGATRAERYASSQILWKWLDNHGNEFGIGRPYLDRDPPHVGPIDGQEYAEHRLGVRTRRVEAAEKQSSPGKHAIGKRAKTAKL
ncbi:hypothetical protein [Bradyrhizobium sp. ORS 86]|uniref:hypothetical protein n=1 Tax=Bradyrhizobium sp. ORS 86 TaxID=1685970 RepID=UPI00388E8D6F